MAEFGNNFNFGDSPLFKDEGWEEWPPSDYVEVITDGDIHLIPDIVGADIRVADRDLERDPTLETATLISLFTDKRARPEDITPDRNEDRRGWFGDSLNTDEAQQDQDGSLLWLLYRSKTVEGIPALAIEYAKEALAWMIADGLAEKVEVFAVRVEWNTLLLTVKIYQPGSVQPELYRYYYNWEAQKIVRRVG